MARRDVFLRLRNTLLARRADLGRSLVRELATLGDFHGADSPGDSADAAFEADGHEMSSQLAALEARELSQVERALERLNLGTFAVCTGRSANCCKKIPVARLNALPYSAFCINCQREMDRHAGWQNWRGQGHWDQVIDWETRTEDGRINFAALEKVASNRRH